MKSSGDFVTVEFTIGEVGEIVGFVRQLAHRNGRGVADMASALAVSELILAVFLDRTVTDEALMRIRTSEASAASLVAVARQLLTIVPLPEPAVAEGNAPTTRTRQ